MGKPSGCEQYGLIDAKRLSRKGGSRHYRGPAMSEALQASTPCYGRGVRQLIQEELGLSLHNTTTGWVTLTNLFPLIFS